MTENRHIDLAAIHRFVQVLENAQWQRNADAFLALFAPEAVWTNPMGRRLTGLAEISDFTRQGLAMVAADVFATYEVEHVTFLGADAAAVNVRSRAVREDRTQIPGEPDGAKLYVLVRHKKDWLLAAGHNTFVMEIGVEAPPATVQAAPPPSPHGATSPTTAS